uniref:Uncharacterized protein n=1 Tax=Micrurus lemniscatus lemniscatus TaxID=129467 RepID=A0A2D4JTD7_MICLE
MEMTLVCHTFLSLWTHANYHQFCLLAFRNKDSQPSICNHSWVLHYLSLNYSTSLQELVPLQIPIPLSSSMGPSETHISLACCSLVSNVYIGICPNSRSDSSNIHIQVNLRNYSIYHMQA